MKAVWYEKFGEAIDVLKYGDFPKPQAKPGEVLVRVSYSGVNPSDVKRRRGTGAMISSYQKVIPHNDGAGVIESAGDGSLSRVGERVWIYEAQIGRPFGTGAEYVAVPKELAVPLPRKVDLAFAASLGVPAMTAHRCVFSGGPVKNQVILVTGGAGSVGNFAIQFAKWGGAQVVASVSSKEKADVALRAHADHVVNYKEENLVSRISEITSGKGVDRVVEVAFGTNLRDDIQMLKANGVIAAYSSDAVREPVFPFGSIFQKNISVYSMLVYTMGKEAHNAALADIATCLERGAFVPNLGKTYQLGETAKAHEDVESGKSIGKVLVKI
jgi:NADPH:quinone reductase